MLINVVKKCIFSEKLSWGAHKTTFSVELYVTTENSTEEYEYLIEQITKKAVPVGFTEKMSFTEQMGSILTWMGRKPKLKLRKEAVPVTGGQDEIDIPVGSMPEISSED